jgi:ribonuclease HI
MEYQVYCNILPNGTWTAFIHYKDELICMEGKENESDKNRNELQSMLEILQFLRKWVEEPSFFNIYTNSQYVINCLYKWIPEWIQKGFRIHHTANLRPNTDLLVKLHSFDSCMNMKLVQHFNEYETYKTFFP